MLRAGGRFGGKQCSAATGSKQQGRPFEARNSRRASIIVFAFHGMDRRRAAENG
jgi:hypothetical protein